ncbi:hypothetical protein NSU_3972 [Novosphingobium pentaromativorans US6-1]|uniref:Uncharacterized protein n=1 Tax=Novosphingobium pentaromativorans US6-1 TaxID=1088721 RepID=G6EI02_9SPHN|nr:hypothetical protein NSU_3972 [Novosphingobium pentaromativorans US6-1]
MPNRHFHVAIEALGRARAAGLPLASAEQAGVWGLDRAGVLLQQGE